MRAGVQIRQAACALSWLQTKDRATALSVFAPSGVRCWCREGGRGDAEGEERQRKRRAGTRWEFAQMNWVGAKS